MADMARRKRKSKARLQKLIEGWLQEEHDLLPYESFILGDTARFMAEAAFNVLDATVDIVEYSTADGSLHWDDDCPNNRPAERRDIGQKRINPRNGDGE